MCQIKRENSQNWYGGLTLSVECGKREASEQTAAFWHPKATPQSGPASQRSLAEGSSPPFVSPFPFV